MLLRLKPKILGGLDQMFRHCLLLQGLQKFTFSHFQQLYKYEKETFYLLHLPWKGKWGSGKCPCLGIKGCFKHLWTVLFCKSHSRIWIILSLLFIPTLHIFIEMVFWCIVLNYDSKQILHKPLQIKQHWFNLKASQVLLNSWRT